MPEDHHVDAIVICAGTGHVRELRRRAGGPIHPVDRWEELRAVSLPVLVGLLVRAVPLIAAGFPLNDGGLFYTMAEDVRRAGFALPAYSTYNGGGIPFVYPPLAFYLAAVLNVVPGLSMTAILVVVPFVASVLTIGAVYLLARELLGSRFEALLAAYAFAVLPRAFDWLIGGGGLTRSPGYLLATLAVWQAARFYRTRSRGSAAATAILAGLTMLTHPEGALFGVVSVAVLLVFLGRDLRALLASIAMLALAALIAAPWWGVALARFGTGPLLSGAQTGLNAHDSLQYVLTWTFTDEPYMTFLAAIGLLGALYCLAHRRWLLPVWVVAIFVVDPRGGSTYVMVPLALLVAVGLREALLGAVVPVSHRLGEAVWPRAVLHDRFGSLVLAAALVLGLIAALKVPVERYDPLHALSPDEPGCHGVGRPAHAGRCPLRGRDRVCLVGGRHGGVVPRPRRQAEHLHRAGVRVARQHGLERPIRSGHEPPALCDDHLGLPARLGRLELGRALRLHPQGAAAWRRISERGRHGCVAHVARCRPRRAGHLRRAGRQRVRARSGGPNPMIDAPNVDRDVDGRPAGHDPTTGPERVGGGVTSARGIELLALSIPMLLGALVRIAPVAGAGFPVGDGGMFYVMVREIQRAGMAIPATTAYDGAGIPFAYPPLGLWLMALAGNVLPVPLLDLFQWWPVVCAILMLPVFYLLARRLLGSWLPGRGGARRVRRGSPQLRLAHSRRRRHACPRLPAGAAGGLTRWWSRWTPGAGGSSSGRRWRPGWRS